MYHNGSGAHMHDIPLSVTGPSPITEHHAYPPQSATAAHLLSPDSRSWNPNAVVPLGQTSSESLSGASGYKYGSRGQQGTTTTDIEEADEAYLSPSGQIRHRIAGQDHSRSLSFSSTKNASRMDKFSPSDVDRDLPSKQPPLVSNGASHGFTFFNSGGNPKRSKSAPWNLRKWWFSLHPFVVFGAVTFSLIVGAMTAYSTYNWAWGRLFGNISDFIPPNASGVVLLASITRVDLDQLEAGITWLPLGCGSEYTIVPVSNTLNTPNWYSHFPLKDAGVGCGRLSKPVEIVVNTGDPFIYDPNSDEYEFVDGTQHGYGAPNFAGSHTWIPSIMTFNTTEKVNPQFAVSRGWNTHAYYPWDAYKVLMRIWVNTPSNTSEKGMPIPVVKVFSLDSPTGLPVESGSWEVVKKSGGVISDVATEALFLIYRHAAVKGFAMVIFFVNWGLMLIMVWILVLVATDRSMKIPKEILLLPITAILTIPQLRATMPGVPSAFGILIDIPGYLFVMIIVVLCAIAIVLLMTHRRQPLSMLSLSRPFRSGMRSSFHSGGDKSSRGDHDDL